MPAIVETLTRGVVLIVGYVIAVFAGASITGYVLSRLQLDETQGKTAPSIKGAGRTIGILERILAVTLIYMNAPTAIALVFAAKSVVRFESSKERPFAEYYLIGTMTSMTIATLVGCLFSYIAESATPAILNITSASVG